MNNENNGVKLVKSAANLLHVSVETFITIVAVILVVGVSLTFVKEMFFTNPVKDIYMNWEDIIYVSQYHNDKKNEEMVYVTIEAVEGMPYGTEVELNKLTQSRTCPIIMSYTDRVPTMKGNTLVLPVHFDSCYGYVRSYNEQLQEE